MLVEGLVRKFIIKEKGQDVVLPDIDPTLTVDQVRKFYSGSYPRLLNSSNPAGEFKDGEMVFEFGSEVVGDKG